MLWNRVRPMVPEKYREEMQVFLNDNTDIVSVMMKAAELAGRK